MRSGANCPKCQSKLTHRVLKDGRCVDHCEKCNGLFMQATDFSKTFQYHPFVENLVKVGLKNAKPTKLSCPSCRAQMYSGEVPESSLQFDECRKCRSIFVDDGELMKFFQLLEKKGVLEHIHLSVNVDDLYEAKNSCPVCKDQKLFGLKGKQSIVLTCFSCGGMATKVEILERLAKKSLFSSSMFMERDGANAFAICRYCHHEQDTKNKHCLKCKKTLSRIQCLSCKSSMSEYSLNDLLIERCVFCNDIWLDRGEFNKVLSALPDVRRVFEKARRQTDLSISASRGANHAYQLSIKNSERKIVNQFFRLFAFAFYD